METSLKMDPEPPTETPIETMNGGGTPGLRRGYSSVTDEVTFVPPPKAGTVSRIGYSFHLITLTLVLYLYTIAIVASLSVQYIYFRLTEYSANTSYPDNSSTCSANTSDDLNDIQREAANFQSYLAISSGIPSMITCVIFGALSDRLGRRMLFAIPVCGMMLRATVYLVVDYTDASLYYLIIGHVIDGLSGGFSCFLLGAFAGSADTTSGGKNRSLRIAITESCGLFSVGLGSLTLGFLIDSYGYSVPNIVGMSVSVVNLVLIIFVVPETRAVSKTAAPVSGEPAIAQTVREIVPHRQVIMTAIKESVVRVFKFYLKKGEGFQRLRFNLCWMAILLSSLTFIGSRSVEMLFQKKFPLCWDSIQIGYFGVITSVGSAIGVVCIIRLLQCCLGDVGIGIFCLTGKLAAFVLEAFSTTDLDMYLVAIIGIASIGAMAMIRSIMSKSTPREDLGAMFASIAFAESATPMIGGILFNSIYQGTVSTHPGLVFIVMALILTVVLVIYCILYCVIHFEKRKAMAGLDDVRRSLLDKDVKFY